VTKFGCSTTTGCLFFGLMILATPSWAQTRPPIAEQIAKTYGLDSFGTIAAIRYTFNVQRPGAGPFSRSWVWQPKTGQVSYEGKNKDGKPVKVTYVEAQLNDAPANVKNQIDPAFVNDQYWLLLPLHVYWDGGADVQDMGTQKLPLDKGSARQVVVKYPSQGGYAPGDTWELYLGSDGRVEEMVYRRGGPKKPRVVMATWAGYKKAGPLLISTEHHAMADGKPALIFFSNVSVKRAGSDTWENAR
jgi:hypothetical protein